MPFHNESSTSDLSLNPQYVSSVLFTGRPREAGLALSITPFLIFNPETLAKKEMKHDLARHLCAFLGTTAFSPRCSHKPRVLWATAQSDIKLTTSMHFQISWIPDFENANHLCPFLRFLALPWFS